MIYVRLKGGLGNQMFEYAAARALSLRNKEKLCIDLDGITNLDHNIFSLDKFNIESELINNKKSLKKLIIRICSSLSYRMGTKLGYNISFKFDLIMSYLLNFFGIYNIENGYVKLKKSIFRNKYLNGYFQSDKYFNDYKKQIQEEFLVKEKVINKELLKNIKNSDSVCVHIRRGDFVDCNGIVCDNKYYINAINYINNLNGNSQFYIFSNDINWVKKNIKFPLKVNFVDGNNPNYEELRLMYSCKHFVISNSTFSWWGQYLSKNKNKIVIAPSVWFKDGQKEDIYQDNWIVMNNDGEVVNEEKRR